MLLALVALVALPPLYRIGLSQAALANGDESIYAEMALEMVHTGNVAELHFDGQSVFPRPPAAIWVLAAAYRVMGTDPVEPPVRVVNAFLCALAVALTVLVGMRMFSPVIGVLAGILLATADLFVGYARAYESEPLLMCFVLGALWAWYDPQRRRRSMIWFGVCLAGALLTKQLVGLLPLAAPLADAIAAARAKRPRRYAARDVSLGLVVALLLAAPWHLYMVAHHGRVFVDCFFVQSLIGRAGAGLLHRTGPWFYLRELWKSERWPFAIWFIVAAVCAAISGLRRGKEPELLVGGWALGVTLVYTIARSRYDYYLLLAYPAFAIAAGWLAMKLPLGATLKSVATALLVIGSVVTHLPRNLGDRMGDEDTRTLLARAPRGLPIYTFNAHPYSARVYGGGPVHVFVELESDVLAAEGLRATGMPAPAILAAPPDRAIAIAIRPSLLLWPRNRLPLLNPVPHESYRQLGDAGYLRLLLLP